MNPSNDGGDSCYYPRNTTPGFYIDIARTTQWSGTPIITYFITSETIGNTINRRSRKIGGPIKMNISSLPNILLYAKGA